MNGKTVIIIAIVAIVIVAATALVLNQGNNKDNPVTPTVPEKEFPDLNENIIVVYLLLPS